MRDGFANHGPAALQVGQELEDRCSDVSSLFPILAECDNTQSQICSTMDNIGVGRYRSGAEVLPANKEHSGLWWRNIGHRDACVRLTQLPNVFGDLLDCTRDFGITKFRQSTAETSHPISPAPHSVENLPISPNTRAFSLVAFPVVIGKHASQLNVRFRQHKFHDLRCREGAPSAILEHGSKPIMVCT
jgi:hypothetical protein